MSGNVSLNWSEIPAHSIPQREERARKSNLLEQSAKLGIKKKVRRQPPTPSEWAHMKSLVQQMELDQLSPDTVTCSLLLTACSDLRALPEGKRVHQLINRHQLHVLDPVLENNIIQMYLRCGCTDLALHVFHTMQLQDAVAWTSLIAAFAHNGHSLQSLTLFRKMLLSGVTPDRVTFTTVVTAVSALGQLSQAKLVHDCALETGLGSDAVVGTAILGMFSKCHSFQDARRAFEGIRLHDRISWTAMITCCGESSSYAQARWFFHRMLLEGVEVTDITLASAINACHELLQGRMLHGMVKERGYERELVVCTALVTMYGRVHRVGEAEALFRSMPRRDVILWTAMIGVYVENGEPRLALGLFHEMEKTADVRANRVTLLTLLNACGEKAALPDARTLHSRIREHGMEDPFTGSAVVAMYGRCGSIPEAREAFERMKVKCSISWNAMLGVHANNGEVEETVKVVRWMVNEGVEANRVTFISLLSVFSHRGMVKEGCEWFGWIREVFMSEPALEHYSCLSDLLGRAGWLEGAESLVTRMPWKPDDGIWVSLLGACRMYGDVERSERVARKVLELQPHNSEAYVVLCNSLKTRDNVNSILNKKM